MKTSKAFPALKKLAGGVAIAAAFGAAGPAHALTINLTSTGNANADAGFQAAANFWQSVFIDPITVNITAGFAPLGPGILGQAGSSYFATTFGAMKAALGADASSADDATMVAGLPGGTSYSKLINGLKRANVEIDRKMLADIAVRDAETFKKIAFLSLQNQ